MFYEKTYFMMTPREAKERRALTNRCRGDTRKGGSTRAIFKSLIYWNLNFVTIFFILFWIHNFQITHVIWKGKKMHIIDEIVVPEKVCVTIWKQNVWKTPGKVVSETTSIDIRKCQGCSCVIFMQRNTHKSVPDWMKRKRFLRLRFKFRLLNVQSLS